jgi:putative ABC transport system permease protein
MLFKLSFRNVKRQIGNYLIYFITVSLTIALIFALNNMIFSDLMESLQKSYFAYLKVVFIALSAFSGVIVAWVLGYATSFLLRRRKKEFGLYLTMGMTRGNILAVFAGETAVTFLVSLGAGILLGMAFYQGLMAIFINYLEIDFTLGGYSWKGLLLTVGLTCAVFLLSSLFSLAYLRLVKISELLHADKIVEKETKIPYVWAALLVIALGLLIFSGIRVYKVFLKDDLYQYISEIAWSVGLFAFSMVVLHIGIAKCIVPLLLKIKSLISRGTAIFTLRQLSGRLNGNAVLAGVLALILSVCLIGTDVFMMQNGFS